MLRLIKDTLKEIVRKIPEDKKAHAVLGFVISLATMMLTSDVWVTLIVVSVVGIGKEIYDYFHPESHTAELMDSLATVAGGVIGVLAYNIITLL